jgi:pilus assembly protein Flp/PilA
MTVLYRFIQDDDGVSAIEYALLASLIAVVIIGAVTTVGTTLQGLFNNVASKL